jgi:hypothetical protein
MALTKDCTIDVTYNSNIDITNLGLSAQITQIATIKNAYIKITQVSGSKTSLQLTVTIFADDKASIVELKSYQFIPSVTNDSTNFIEQAYVSLKTLTEFKDAVDC